QETLRPGTVYADPYGHILMIVRRVPQSDAAAGVILAVDGQPDGTVARKRFWRGNFLFAQDPALGSPGFKRFRPILRDRNVARRPERYAMPKEKSVASVKAELQSVLVSELATRKFSYPRSDGSPWTLALKDVVERVVDLEMAYNPNDCIELRWGAPAKSEEA